MNKLTREEFARFLAVLDSDPTRAAEKYELLRRKLVKLFDRQQFLHTEELADETLDRLVKRLETEQIHNISLFAYGIARNICFEARRKKSQCISIQDHYKNEELCTGDPDPEQSIITELGHAQTLECLTKCLRNLPFEYHELILEYYQEEKQARIKRRKDLARKRGITIEALRCEANKVRERLRGCVKRCLSVRRFEKYAPGASQPQKGGAGER
jgi:DNA-directed RNA polymerase specialized sigma24 family protein